jgi:acetyltransferase-like isoleucine patch superfamily enzyme
MSRRLIKRISIIYRCFLAHTIYAKRYEKKYLSGRWFSGKYGGYFAKGWHWVYYDARNNKRLGRNMDVPWPVSPNSRVIGAHNIKFCPDDLNNFQMNGLYIQGVGEISIGKGTYIASNVGIITANHNLSNLNENMPPKPVSIGENCWIGMNSVILPGVTLGYHTIVGAGSVVTKSFPEGNCVIAGNPAKMIKSIGESATEK